MNIRQRNVESTRESHYLIKEIDMLLSFFTIFIILTSLGSLWSPFKAKPHCLESRKTKKAMYPLKMLVEAISYCLIPLIKILLW